MANTSAIGAASGSYTPETQTRQVKKSLGQDDFLQLLVAQLANQDPLAPTSDTEFIAQLAQFSSLEQMQSMNQAMLATQQALLDSQVYGMVGKHVYVATPNEAGEDTLVFGKVDGVLYENGTQYLVVGEGKYLLADVVGVADVKEDQESIESKLALCSNFIGKNVKAQWQDEEGEDMEAVGIVGKVFVKDAVVYAKVGDKDVPVSAIKEIMEQQLISDNGGISL
ncbi:MAG: flagellar hook capping FlgD N-terminal domain-containing protein [Christensenellales bacterium]|jgi:flagellar basal-body rod modification protein FlgD